MSRSSKLAWFEVAAVTVLLIGCQAKNKQPTAEDVARVSADAQQEVAEARVEAAKDLKSAVKIGSPNPAEVAVAKATAAYDIAMAKADGDHKVAAEKCLTLPATEVARCSSSAEADYDSAKAAAKSARTHRME